MSKHYMRKKHIQYQDKFQEDCEILLRRFLELSTFSFETFTRVWNEMKFSLIFLGSYQKYQLVYFVTTILHCVKKYLILPECKRTQVCALYMVYTLYFKQPVKHGVRIRLLLEELIKVNELLEFCKQEKVLEPLYIYERMLEACAFDFVATQLVLPLEGKFVASDLELVNDIFPKDYGKITHDFHKETGIALMKIKQIDADFERKLAEYKSKNKNIKFIHYDSSYALHKLEVGLNINAKSDSTTKLENMNLDVSDNRDQIKRKAFEADSRSKFLKQLVGEEKIKKMDKL